MGKRKFLCGSARVGASVGLRRISRESARGGACGAASVCSEGSLIKVLLATHPRALLRSTWTDSCPLKQECAASASALGTCHAQSACLTRRRWQNRGVANAANRLRTHGVWIGLTLGVKSLTSQVVEDIRLETVRASAPWVTMIIDKDRLCVSVCAGEHI